MERSRVPISLHKDLQLGVVRLPRQPIARTIRITELNFRSSSSSSSNRSPLFDFFPTSQKPWHNANFLDKESDLTKEKWLTQLQMDSPHLVDRQAFLVVLRSIAVSGAGDGPMRAERLVWKLEELWTEEENEIRKAELEPNAECYRRVIESWSNATNEDIKVSLVRAEKMLQKRRRPETECYNAFLDLCTKGRGAKYSRVTVEENAQKAEDLLRFMIDDKIQNGDRSVSAPNLDSFNYVIRGWTRCRKNRDIAAKTTEALRLLEHYHSNVDSCVQPDTKSYSMLMDAFSIQAKLKVSTKHVDKDDKACNGMNEINLIEELLEELHKNEAEGYMHLAPTTAVYNQLLSCWAHLAKLHSHAPFEAEKVKLSDCDLDSVFL